MKLADIPVIHPNPHEWVASQCVTVPATRRGACDGCVFKHGFGCQYPQQSVASHTEPGCLAHAANSNDIVYAPRITARKPA